MKSIKMKYLLSILTIAISPIVFSSCSNSSSTNNNINLKNIKGAYDSKTLSINIEGENLDKIETFHLETIDGSTVNFKIIQKPNLELNNTTTKNVEFQLINEINEHSNLVLYIDNDSSTKKNFSISPKQNLSSDLLANQTSGINNLKIMNYKSLNYVTRTPNKKVYSTELLQKYQQNGFRYPSWDFNYEKNNNKFLDVPGNTPGTTTRLNLQDIVIKERVSFVDGDGTTKETTYNDPAFILNEIENNNLKIHPAAKTWYESSVNDSTKSLTKEFTIDSTANNDIQLGIYAPPGEVITIQFDTETSKILKENNLREPIFSINSGIWDNKVPGAKPETGLISNRYPFVRSNFLVKKGTNSNTLKIGSPFGGPISFNINNRNFPPHKIKFKVFGGIEQLHYEDGITTEQEWKNQIRKLNSGEITAPIVSANAELFSLAIHFREKNKADEIPIQKFNYPKEIFQEINQFFYISNFVNNRYERIKIEVCDDLWGGAAGWGGGSQVHVPSGAAAKTFFANANNSIDAGLDWLILHETNHNFEMNGVLFNKRSHGKTNQLTIASMSMFSNDSRWRSAHYGQFDYDYGSEWDYLTNPYWNIKKALIDTTVGKNKYEWTVDSLVLYLLGPKKYFEYVKQDLVSTTSIGGGFNEIIDLSKFINYNLWPAFRMFAHIWNDNWPTRDVDLTSDQKNKLKTIEHLPEIDFVGNIYAVGSYNYNQGNWIYGEDYNAPFQIPFGDKEILFDFEHGINSRNENFNWNEINFNETTKAGGKLKKDPKNNKNLIYIPPSNVQKGDLDEFDISIKPNFPGKPENYVPEYRWKIKLRQTFETAIFRSYDSPNSSMTFDEEIKTLNDKNTKTFSFFREKSNIFKQKDAKNKIFNISMKFIVPENGKYKVQAKWLDEFRFYIDGEELFSRGGTTVRWWYVTNELDLKKGQIITIDAYSRVKNSSSNSNGELGLKIHRMDETFPNGFEQMDLSVTTTLKNIEDPISDLNNPNYKYKKREFDTKKYSNIGSDQMAFNQYNKYVEKPKMMDLENVTLSTTSKNPQAIARLNNLKNPNSFLEYAEPSPAKTTKIDIKMDFPEPTIVRAIEVFARTSNHTQHRGTGMQITGELNENGRIKNIVLYDGEYKTRRAASSYYSVVDLKNPNRKFNSITLNIKNDLTSGLSLNTIGIYDEVFGTNASIIPSNSPKINFFGEWNLIQNNPSLNMSNVNNIALTSKRKNEYLEFDITGNNLIIVGKKGVDMSSFDVYIDDIKVGSDISTTYSQTEFNQKLFSHYIYSEKNTHRIKIVNKSNKELTIDNFIVGLG